MRVRVVLGFGRYVWFGSFRKFSLVWFFDSGSFRWLGCWIGFIGKDIL